MALRPKKDPWVRSFSVTDPTLHPNGYTVYKVRMQAFCTLAPEETQEICAWKRYSDLKKLHTVLSTLHRNLHRPGIFPSFAEPVVFGRFNSEVIEVRCKSAHTMLQFIGSQSHLYNSPAFQNFLKISETVPCPDNQIDHCAVLSPCCVDDDETRYGARPSDVRSICPSSASANGTLSTSLPPLTIQMGIGVSALVNRSTTLLSASVDIGDSCVAPMPSSTPTPSSHNALGAAYRASRDLAMFDPLNNKDETLDVAHSAEASESDVFEDLSAWADVSSPLRLPEVPAADLGLHLISISGPDPTLPIKDSLNGETLEDLPTAPSDSIAEVASARDDYLSDAEAQAQQGERYFALGKHEVSLKHYECAVTLLIRGVQDDINEERRAAAGKRTRQYLEHAQRIAKGFLRKESGGSSSDSTVANSSASSDAVLAAPSLRLGAVSFDLPSRSMWLTAGENDIRRQGNLRGSVEELSNYKVLGVIDKVMLVLDKLNEQTYVMKVLQKNELADQTGLRVHHKIPTNCPHMVRIHRYYETDSTIYLLLQHASGGRLWSYASSYLHSHSGSSVRPRLFSSKDDSDNVYSGRRCAAAAADSLLDDEATPAATEQGECSKAYLDLLYDTSRLAPKTNCEDGSVASLIQERSSEDDSSHHSGRRTTATVAQQLSTPLSRSTSDPSTTKFSVAGSIAGAAPASNAAPAARRWSVASDELGLPPPPPSLHRLASSAAARHQSVPESCVRQWAAEMLAAVVHLHSLGVVCRDLRPDNILLGEGGHVLLTFFGKWVGVRGAVHADAVKDFYAAPELQKPLTPGASVPATCDWWSLGVLLYELLVGCSLRSAHPDGIGTHTVLSLPSRLSVEARDLLTQLVKCNPSERLGCGPDGEEDIMSHPFFSGLDWSTISHS